MTDAMQKKTLADDGPKADALGEQARGFLDEGRFAEAEALYLQLTQKFPGARRYRMGYVRAAIEACRTLPETGRRREELTRYVVEKIADESGEGRLQAVRFLVALCSPMEGKNFLLQTVAHAASLKDLQASFQFIPRFVEHGERGALWSNLLSRLAAIAPSIEAPDRDAAIELKLRLLLALERFPDFIALFDESRAELENSNLLFLLQRVRDRLAGPRAEVFAEAKVFGIGLSRTGTTSLAKALTLLGIDAAHWTNPLTQQVISEIDMFMFGACTDCCVSADFEKLYYLYPNARFILTQRPIDDWVRAFWKHHERTSWVRDMDGFRRAFGKRPFPETAIEFALYTQSADVAQSYRCFEGRVQTFFADKPGTKLLTLDVFAGQGWPELCGFLERPVPELPFPALNESA